MCFFWLRHVNIFLAYSLLHYVFQAIALFNANRHKEAMMRIQELAAACPNADTLACDVVKVSIMHSISIYVSFVR
jgi:hypothetical protein